MTPENLVMFGVFIANHFKAAPEDLESAPVKLGHFQVAVPGTLIEEILLDKIAIGKEWIGMAGKSRHTGKVYYWLFDGAEEEGKT